jgi:hypothetical protein
MKSLLLFSFLLLISCASAKKDFTERRSLMLLSNGEMSKNKHFHPSSSVQQIHNMNFGFKPVNIVGAVFAPTDHAFGLSYANAINPTGVYCSVSYGAYRLQNSHIIPHLKAVAGIEYFCRPFTPTFQNTFNCGFSVHQFGKNKSVWEYGNKYFPISAEVGTGAIIKNRFVCGFNYDPFKKECAINFGIKF